MECAKVTSRRVMFQPSWNLQWKIRDTIPPWSAPPRDEPGLRVPLRSLHAFSAGRTTRPEFRAATRVSRRQS